MKEMGHYCIQIGLYLSSINLNELKANKKIYNNIINFLLQLYLYLQSNNEFDLIESDEIKTDNKDIFLSRKELIEKYKPLFTEYGLTQAIHKKELPYIKRGNKYFFNQSEIEKWINTSKKVDNKKIKYV